MAILSILEDSAYALMYQKIKAHPTTRKRYADRLIEEDVITKEQAEGLVSNCRDALDHGEVVAHQIVTGASSEYVVDWTPYKDVAWTHPADTAVPTEMLQKIAEQINQDPKGFELHPRVSRILQDRRKMAAGGHPIDWGTAGSSASLCP